MNFTLFPLARAGTAATLLWMAAAMLPVSPALAQNGPGAREQARLGSATEVLQELRASPDQHVPDWLLQRAYGVAVFPDVLKGAFIFGGRYGTGVLTVRDAAGRFSNPVFISLAGGSVGWQIGASSTDVVLVLMTRRSVEHFSGGKFTLGVDASVAAGPVGRQGEAQGGVSAEIYSYSRSRGLFAGVALDGTVLAFDGPANRAFYGQSRINAAMITSGQVTTSSPAAQRFIAAVAASAGGQPAAAPTVAGAAAPPAPTGSAAGAPGSGSGSAGSNAGAQAYPLPDSHPGTEPPQ